MSDLPRLRILLVTRNLPPLVGGMERLNWHMADELSRHAEVRIVGPAGSAATTPAAVAVDEVPLRPLWKFLIHAQGRAWRTARAWKPDVVLAGSGLTAPAAWLAARASGARAAVYVHGLDLVVRHPVYRCLWRPALRHMDRVIANSRPTAALAQGIGVKPGRIGIVCPGVDLPADATTRARDATKTEEPFSTQAIDRKISVADFRQHHGLGNRPLLLSVGRLSTRKGLREFVVEALPRIVAVYPDVLLLVVGDAPRDALHAQAQTPQSIQAAAEQMGVAKNLRFLGAVTDSQLDSAYRAADVHVFPVRDIPGDPEGFGMVAVEAAAHGLPTVAFASGGVVDAVAEGESGYLIVGGDYAGFAHAVLRMLAETTLLRKSSEAFARRFAWSEFGQKVAALLTLDGSTTAATGCSM
ncbi:glycosyltransferase family 4 protein [Rhodanobacter sp. Si-c]|uniref:Glycosyltransferase family 4 protein n=1 Tax=Rhodanobacter lycopersici TaxID=3162487 RepID=A0ABV3QBG9_9GAMM